MSIYRGDPSLQFNVDIALNGQQFSGRTITFKYYDIKISRISPTFSTSQGGASISIFGSGLYDSKIKKVRFRCFGGGEREVSADWDKKQRCLQCIVPPLTWLFGGENVDDQ